MNKIPLVFFLASTLFLLACSRGKPAETEASAPEKKEGPKLIAMGLQAQKHVGLEVAAAQVQQLAEYLQVTGTVQPIDSRIGHVRPLARGRVQEALAKVGDRVAAGQELARFDNIEAGELASQYQSARAELQRFRVQEGTAARQMERNRRLSEIGTVPQKDFEVSQSEHKALLAEIEAQEGVVDGLAARLRRFGMNGASSLSSSVTAIRSPFAGVLIQATVAPGQVVTGESDLFQLADLSQVWVQAEVYEKDLARVRIGQPALITVDTYPDEYFKGKVTYIGDILDPKTRTAKVRCEVSNPGARLKLDMFASVKLPTTFAHRGLAIPTTAIQQVENKNVVFVQKGENTFEVRPVEVGKTLNGTAEILRGITEGERIVVSASFHLKSILLGKEFAEEE